MKERNRHCEERSDCEKHRHCKNALKSSDNRRKSNRFKNNEYTIHALTAAKSENCGGTYFGGITIPSSIKSYNTCKSSNVVLPTNNNGIYFTNPRCTAKRI